MNRSNLEAKISEIASYFEKENSEGAMTLEVREYAVKPSLRDISTYYKEEGYSDDELRELQYQIITQPEMKEEFESFLRVPSMPSLRVFADDLVKTIIVSEKTECILVQNSTDGSCYMLSILTGSALEWSLLDFWWQFD